MSIEEVVGFNRHQTETRTSATSECFSHPTERGRTRPDLTPIARRCLRIHTEPRIRRIGTGDIFMRGTGSTKKADELRSRNGGQVSQDAHKAKRTHGRLLDVLNRLRAQGRRQKN